MRNQIAGSASGSVRNTFPRKHPHRDLSTTLRFGQDDKGEGRYLSERSRPGWTELRPATPQRLQIPPLRFASVGMTRGGWLLFGKVCDSDGQTYERYSANNAGPSTTLRFGRDDKGRVVTFQKGRGLDGRSYEPLPREYPGLKARPGPPTTHLFSSQHFSLQHSVT
jgi:hypothetical protein